MGSRRRRSIASRRPTHRPACGAPSSLSPLNVTTSTPLSTASATSVSPPTRSPRAFMLGSSMSPEPRSQAVATSCRRPSSAMAAGSTSLVKPTTRKFEGCTFMSSPVSAVSAAS